MLYFIHKSIGILYILIGLWIGIVSYFSSGLIRLFLLVIRDDLLLVFAYYLYNMIITFHGLTMLFFVVMPVAIGGFGNFFIPILLSLEDLVFPRLNAISVWFLVFSLLFLLSSVFFGFGAGTGWTLYPPLSNYLFHNVIAVDLVIFSIHLAGLSSIVGAINFIVTILQARPAGSVYKLPLYIWSLLVTAIMLLLALPVLAGVVTMLLLDRHFNTSYFDGMVGGDPILFQHLFWFFGFLSLRWPCFAVMQSIIMTLFAGIA